MNRRARMIIAVLSIVAIVVVLRNRNPSESPSNPSSVVSAAPVIEAPRAPGPRDVLVAKQNLDPALSSRPTTDAFELKTIPESVPLPPAELLVRSTDQLKGKVLTDPIAQGEIVLRSRFADFRKGIKHKLSDLIAVGHRAMSIDVEAVVASAGFISQGDVVDIYSTYELGGRQLTRIIMQNVEVLARGYDYNLKKGASTNDRTTRGDAGVMTLTFDVTPEMALKIAQLADGRSVNRIRIALKNHDDRTVFYSAGVRLREVLLDETRAPVAAGKSVEDSVIEVHHGLNITQESTEDRRGAGHSAGKDPGLSVSAVNLRRSGRVPYFADLRDNKMTLKDLQVP